MALCMNAYFSSEMNGDWTSDPRFGHYWTNYQHARNWYQQHQIAYWKAKFLATQYENEQLHFLLQSICENGGNLTTLPQPPAETLSATAVDAVDAVDDDEDFEMEVSDDMLEFFAQSMKHKKERREMEEKNEVSYVRFDELPIETRGVDLFGINVPDNSGDSQKLDSYRRLYGDKANRIYAMETAMELTFHRNCDLKQPKLWPNMPLKL